MEEVRALGGWGERGNKGAIRGKEGRWIYTGVVGDIIGKPRSRAHITYGLITAERLK
jgi:hypothetical protein